MTTPDTEGLSRKAKSTAPDVSPDLTADLSSDFACLDLFDHVVRLRHHERRNGDPKRPRRLQVDRQLEPGRQLNRYVLGFPPEKHLANLPADITKDGGQASTVGDKRSSATYSGH